MGRRGRYRDESMQDAVAMITHGAQMEATGVADRATRAVVLKGSTS